MNTDGRQAFSVKPARLTLFIGLVLAGLAGNYFRFPIFFNIEFLFGGIFAMLALQTLGLGYAVAAALAISSYTYFAWNHPYAIVIMTAEVLVVGLLNKRRNVSLVVADTLYWLLIGMPLVVVFYYLVMHLTPSNTMITMMKQALNGIGNVLIARLIYMAVSSRMHMTAFSLREVVFNLLALFVLLSSLFLLVIQSRNEFSETDHAVRGSLSHSSRRVQASLDSWLQANHELIIYLASLAPSHNISEMQNELEHANETNSAFFRMGLLDAKATIVAYSPLYDELGKTNIGKNFAERSYISALKKTLKPMFSEVVMGKLGTPRPIITMLAPVVKNGAYDGYTVGVLDLDRMREIVAQSSQAELLPGLQYTLLDKNGKVIITNRTNQIVMETFDRGAGEMKELGDGVAQWVPSNKRNVSISDRWKSSYYISEGRIGQFAEWRLILEQPIAPIQQRLYEKYAAMLGRVFAILFLSLVLAEFLSRKIIASLHRLRLVTQDIPVKLASEASIKWPEDSFSETGHLIDNYRQMTDALAHQFKEMRNVNSVLEDKVRMRTEELRQSETKYRMLVESSPDILYIYSNKRSGVFYSSQVEKILGYTVEYLMEHPTLWYSSIHPDDRSKVDQAIRDGVGGERIEIEYRIRNARGQWIWLLDRFIEVTTDEGETLIQGLATDITINKLMHENLSRVLTEQRIILDNANISISLVVDRKQVWVNRGMVEMFGYGTEELEHQTTRKLYPDDETYERFGREAYPELAKGLLYESEQKLIKRDGTEIWVRYNGKAIDPSDMSKGTLWLLDDITERRNARERLAQLAKEQQTILDTMTVGISLLKKRKVQWANAAHDRMFGYEPGVTRGIDTSAFYVDSASYERLGAGGYATLQTGATFYDEIEMKKADGSLFWCSLTGRAVDPANMDEGSIWMVQDITERKRTQDALSSSALYARTLIEASVDPLVTINAEGKITDVNAALELATGLGRDKLIGTEFSDYFTEPQKAREGYQQVFLHGEVKAYPLKLRTIDGGTADVLYNARIYRNASGEVEGVFAAARDITEVRKTQEALSRLAKEQKTILDTMTAGLAYLKDRKIQWANAAIEKMLGYAPGELIGVDTERIYADPEDYARIGVEAYPKLSYGEAYNIEVEMKRADGTRLWCLLTGRAVNPDNIDEGSIWMLQDITQSKKAQDALRESEQRFRNMADTAPVLIWMSDQSRGNTFVNKQWCDYTGMSARQTLGYGWADAVHPDDMKQLSVIYAEAFDGQQFFQTEFRLRRHDGQYRWFSINGLPRHEGDAFIGYIGSCFDVNEQKELQASLKKLTMEQSVILENSSVGIALIINRTLSWVNDRFTNLFGYQRQELVGRNTAILYPDEEIYNEIGREAYPVIATGQTYEREVELKRADGALFWGKYYGKAVNASDPSAGSIWVMEDVTGRKKAEAQLKLFADTQRVLFKEVNHRVKNNLTAIIGLLRIEEDKAREEGHGHTLEILADFKSRVSGLLTVHSLLSGSGWRPIGISELCEEIVRVAIDNSKQTGSTRLLVQGSPILLSNRQAHNLTLVINELATNSIKHFHREDAALDIIIDFALQDRMVAIRYRDNGSGYPAEFIAGDFSHANVGMDLVRGIVEESLGGSLILTNDGGAVTVVKIKPETQEDET